MMDCLSDYGFWLFESIGCSSQTTIRIVETCITEGSLAFGKRLQTMLGNQRRTSVMQPTDYDAFERHRTQYEPTEITRFTYWDDIYPSHLKEIYNPPAVLYALGNLDLLNLPLSFGIVGTRNPSEYGKKTAYTLAKELAASGICIVSGFAMGIDAYAHRGAVEAGATIAVLGCGVDQNYPQVNSGLKRILVEKGLILSEFPPGTQAKQFHFPLRNRIISGLSKGVLVVEAAPKSGSLITARLAMEQNRDVFAIPGEIFKAKSQGCNQLIREGAGLVSSTFDILQHYGLTETEKIRTFVFKGHQEALYKMIKDQGSITFDELYEGTQMEMGELMLDLFQLELMKAVELRAGNHYMTL